MYFYTLTHVTYDKRRPIEATLQSNVLLFSEKYDIIYSTLQQQEQYIIQHLKETHEIKDIKTEHAVANLRIGLDTTRTPLNSIIETPTYVHLLVINQLFAEEKTEDEKDKALQLGDFVVLKQEAQDAIRARLVDNIPRNLKLAKIISIDTDDTATIMCLALDTSTSSPTNTDYVGARCTIPLKWLRRIYL
jgi:hypothetical protein